MTTRTLEQDFGAVTDGAASALSQTARWMRDRLNALGPYGGRMVVTGLGALIALSLGATAAFVFRLPADMKDAAPPADQTLLQQELPSDAAARANALENPPTYTVAAQDGDEAAKLDAADPTLPSNDAALLQTAETDEAEQAPHEARKTAALATDLN